jgi:hypothetical protein
MRDDSRAVRASASETAQERARMAALLDSGALEARLSEARAKRAEALARKPSRFSPALAARIGRARPGLAVGAERGEADIAAPPVRAAPAREADFQPGAPSEAEPAPAPLARTRPRHGRPARRSPVWLAVSAAFATGAAAAFAAATLLLPTEPDDVAVAAPETVPPVEAPVAPAAKPALSVPAVPGVGGAEASKFEPPAAEAFVGPVPPSADAPASIGALATAPVVERASKAPLPESVSIAPAPAETAAVEALASVAEAAPGPADSAESFEPASGVASGAAPMPMRPLARPSRTVDAAAAPRAPVVSVQQPGTAPTAALGLPTLPTFGAEAAQGGDAGAPRADPGIAVWLPDQPTARASGGRRAAPQPTARPATAPARNIVDAARRDLAGIAAAARGRIGAALGRSDPKVAP